MSMCLQLWFQKWAFRQPVTLKIGKGQPLFPTIKLNQPLKVTLGKYSTTQTAPYLQTYFCW